VLSTVAAWYLFLLNGFGWEFGSRAIVQSLLFLFINGVNVGIAVVLDAIVDRLVLQERNIRLLLNSVPNGFVLVDDNGTIRLANQSAGKLVGYTPEELAGKQVEVLVPPQQAEDHWKMRAQYQKKPEVRPTGAGRDLNGRRKDGTDVPIEIGLNPVG
jgi:PAS domain S-box-containing protein